MRDNNDNRYYATHRDSIVKAGLILAFFHDVYHAPFGHVLDPLCPLFLTDSDFNRLDRSILRLELFNAVEEKRGLAYDLLNQRVFDHNEGEMEEVFDVMIELLHGLDRKVIPDKLKSVTFVFDILSSVVDHDRLDYITRDSNHILPHQTSFLLSDIIEGARVDWMSPAKDEARLMFTEDTGHNLQDMLRRRQRFYNQVYEAVQKAPYDEMILHAVIYTLEEYGVFENWVERSVPRALAREVGTMFCCLSDLDLNKFISQSERGGRTLIAQMLMRDVMTNAPFVFATYDAIKNKQIPDVQERYAVLRKRCDEVVAETLSQRGARKAFGLDPDKITREAKKEAYEKVKKIMQRSTSLEEGGDIQELQPIPQEGIFWLLNLFGWHALHRIQFEEWLWKEVQKRWDGFDEWASRLGEEIREEYTFTTRQDSLPDAGEIWEIIEETPLIFLAASRIGGSDIEGLLYMDRKEERGAVLYKPNGEITDFEPGDPASTPSNYWLGTVCPQSMPEEIYSIVSNIMNDILFEYEWVNRFVDVKITFRS